VVVQLRALAPLAFYESLAKPWPPGLLAAVKKALAPYLPHLERELGVFLRYRDREREREVYWYIGIRVSMIYIFV